MDVSTGTARRWVLVSVTGMLIINAYRGKLGNEPIAKRLWGTGVLAIMLGFAADTVPQIAGPFAILLLVGTLTSSGDQAIQTILSKASGSGSPGPSAGAPTGAVGPTAGHAPAPKPTKNPKPPVGAVGPTAPGR